MADNVKLTLTNTAQGLRGVHTVDGPVDVEPGQTVTVTVTPGEAKSAKGCEYFDVGGASAAAAKKDAPPSGDALADAGNNVPKLKKVAKAEGIDLGDAKKAVDIIAAITKGREAAAAAGEGNDALDDMSDEELRDTVKVLTGADAPEDADRDALLALARAPSGTE